MAEQTTDPPVLGVGMVGYAFMGAAHSQAWRTAPHVFDLPLRPAMAALCGRNASAVRAAAARSAAAAIASASSSVLASGFSHSTCLPASSAAMATSACPSPGVHTSTSCTSSRLTRSI